MASNNSYGPLTKVNTGDVQVLERATDDFVNTVRTGIESSPQPLEDNVIGKGA